MRLVTSLLASFMRTRLSPSSRALRQRARAGRRAAGALIALAAAAALLGAGPLPVAPALAQQTEGGDRTLSPYFFVQSKDPSVDRLPLKATSAEVRIAGVIADVTVTQLYKNEGRHALEAIYVFPGSTRAAVYGMRMTIGKRTIEAVVQERGQARQAYEQARQQGRTASLLEQQRPNVFQMNVANIMPGDEIKVELRYTELLVPTEGVYEFVYPTVVGPRYSNQPAAGAPDPERWVENPYQHQGQAPLYTFDINVTLSAGLPIDRVICPSHKTDVDFDGPSVAHVKLDGTESHGGNRDFVLRYGLAGAQVQSGLLLFQGKDESFFLLMVQPPRRVSLDQIPPREYIFVVDVSGSMHGFPLEVSKKLLADLIGHLRPTDTFNVLLFSGGNAVMAESSLPATPGDVQRAITLIEQQQGGGGTELLPALRRALALPRTDGVSRTVVIATDGYVAVEKESFDLIRSNLNRCNVFAFGIGSAVNRFLIEGIARAGMGEPFVVARQEEAAGQAEKFRAYVQSPVLTDVKVDFGRFAAYDVEPPALPDVLAERPVIVFGKWRGRAEGKISVRGSSGEGPYVQTFDVSRSRPSAESTALRYLWARHRIAMLGDYQKLRGDGDAVKEITRLGLAYNLLTDYTSFVAIDQQVRNTDGRVETVKQPLPLPQGVSDLAVGNQAAKMAYAPASVAGGVAGGIPGGMRADARISEEVLVDKLRPPRGDAQDQARTEATESWRSLKQAVTAWQFPAASGRSVITARLTLVQGNPTVVAVRVKGGLAREAAERVLRSHLSEMKPWLESSAPGGGETVLIITVRPDGTVDNVQTGVQPS
jgi:Ca-activated chloride channel homolog